MAATLFALRIFTLLLVLTLTKYCHSTSYQLLSCTYIRQDTTAGNIRRRSLHSTNGPSRPITAWRKRGQICLYKPDLTIALDVEPNPGPDTTLSGRSRDVQRESRPNLQPGKSNSTLEFERIVYFRNELLHLRPSSTL